MQATVATYDPVSRTGRVLTDAGMPMNFGPATLAEHVRHLRVGQRVFVETDGDTVTGIAIWV